MAPRLRIDTETTTSGDETCPLLRDDPPLENQVWKNTKPTPLPKLALLALGITRLVEPVTFTQIFPYVNEFMSDLHVTDDPSKIGFYSGIVVSIIYF